MPRYAPTKLTESFIKALPHDSTAYLVRDTKVTGLLVAVNKTVKSFKVQRDLWQGTQGRRRLVKTVRHTLGSTEDLSLEEARLRAQDIILLVKRGIDPNAPQVATPANEWTLDNLLDEYAADLRKRECSERTVEDMLARRDLYLTEWKSVPLKQLTRSMLRAKHDELTRTRGKITANHVMRDFRAAYNLALRVIDNPDLLPDNPVKAVTFNKERRKNAVIMPEDLPEWWEKLQGLPNPMRRLMHELGLYSGLRPGTLVTLQREWVKLEVRAISIPRMKSGRSFDLPLSTHMMEVLKTAMDLSERLFPNSRWLFPTRAVKPNLRRGVEKGDVIPTQVWRERPLPGETGHILRHTYRTIAQREQIDRVEARLLLDHSVPGIDGVYIHERALFDRLLAAQERMSRAISDLLKRG